MNAPVNAALASGHPKGDTPPGGTVPLWLLALLAFSGTLAMHVFVPALPIAQADLGGGMAAMQLTISLYILGLAGGQLVYGPLADRFGRRPILMAGLSLYTVAGLAAMLAPSVTPSSPRGCSRRWAAAPGSCWHAPSCAIPRRRRTPPVASP